MPPLISVILTTYNRPQFLPEAVDSILAQTLRDFELIIVDDGSDTPETEQIAARYAAADNRVKYIKKENGGVSSARNSGVAAASGKYIAFMDDDDISRPRRLEKQVSFLEQNPRFAAVGCGITLINKVGDIIRKASNSELLVQDENPPLENAIARHKRIFLGSGAVMRREIYLEIGGCNEEIRTMEDRDFMMKLEEKYAIAKIPDDLYLYRQHDDENLFLHPMAWHYFCATYIMAYFRRQDAPVPDCPATRLIEYMRELPVQLQSACVRSARGTAKRFMRGGEHSNLHVLLSDFNMVFCQNKKAIFSMYIRMVAWSAYYAKVKSLPVIVKGAFAGLKCIRK